ncbi:MAG: AI-2E family transporter [Crocinitomicaceae bacterium]
MNSSQSHPALNLLLIALILAGLYIGQNLLIPLVLGLLFWYLINSLRRQIGLIRIANRALPNWLQIFTAASVMFGLIWFIVRIVAANLEELQLVSEAYNQKLLELSGKISDYLNITSIEEVTKSVDLGKYAETILESSYGFLTGFFVVLFYVIFIIAEQSIFKKKLDLVLEDRKQKIQFFRIITQIDDSVHSYLSVKAILSLVVAIITYIVLISFGVDFAVLWALLTFLLNFIPFIGSLLAILFPVLLSFLQFSDPITTLVIGSVLVGNQVLFGNFIEPRMVGKSLNLSPLVVVLALAFWGALWGVVGMFLCVPITVTLMIIMSQFPRTRAAAIMLSAGEDFVTKKDR